MSNTGPNSPTTNDRRIVRQLELENENLQSQLATVRAAEAAATSRLRERELALSDALAELDGLRDDQAATTNVRHAADRDRARASAAEARARALQESVDRLTRDLDEATDALEAAVNKSKADCVRADRADAAANIAKDEAEAANAEVARLMAALRSTNMEGLRSGPEISSVQLAEAQAQAAAAAEAAVRAELQGEMRELRQALIELETENATLNLRPAGTAPSAPLLHRVGQLEAEASELSNRVVQLESENESLKEANAKLEGELSHLRARRQAPVGENLIAQIVSPRAVSNETIETLQKALSRVRSEATDLRARCTLAETAAARASAEAAELQVRRVETPSEVEERLHELGVRLAARDADICRLTAELNAAINTNSLLGARLEYVERTGSLTGAPVVPTTEIVVQPETRPLAELAALRACFVSAKADLEIARTEAAEAAADARVWEARARRAETTAKNSQTQVVNITAECAASSGKNEGGAETEEGRRARHSTMRCKGIQVQVMEETQPRPLTPISRQLAEVPPPNLTGELNAAKQNIIELRQRLAQTVDDLNAAQNDRAVLRNRIDTLTQQLSSTERRLAAQPDGSVSSEKVKAIAATVETLEGLLKRRDDHIRDLQNKLIEARRAAVREPARPQESALTVPSVQQLAEIQQLRDHVNLLSTQLAATKSNCVRDPAACAACTGLRLEVSTLRQQIAALTNASVQVFNALGVDANESQAAEKVMNEIKRLRALDRQPVPRPAPCQKCSSLRQQLVAAEHRCDHLEQQLYKTDQSDLITSLQEELAELRAELDTARAMATAATVDARDARRRLDSISETVAASDRARATSLAQAREIVTLRQELAKLQAESADAIAKAEADTAATKMALHDATTRLAMRDNVRLATLKKELATAKTIRREESVLGDADFVVRDAYGQPIPDPARSPIMNNTVRREGVPHGVQTEQPLEQTADGVTLARIRATNNTLREEARKLTERNVELADKLAAAGRDLSESRTAAVTAKSNADKATSALKAARKRIAELEVQVQGSGADSLVKEIDTLKSRLGASQAQVVQLKKEIGLLTDKIAKLESEKRYARDTAAAQSDLAQTHRTAAAERDDVIAELQEEIARKDRMLIRLRNEIHSLAIGGQDTLEDAAVLRATNVGLGATRLGWN